MVPMRFVALIVMLLLVGCSSVTTIPPELSLSEKERLWQENRQQLELLDTWSLIGRLGLTVPDRSGSMSIEWSQAPQQYSIYLDGPFGQSLAQIQGDRSGVSAKISDGERVEGPTPEYLMLQLTGWNFPVSNLKFWVKGLPAPGDDAEVSLNSQGYPQQILQQGWQIDYLSYRPESVGLMPVRLKASNGDVRITLVVRTWQLQ